MTVDDAGSSRLVPASLQTAGGARVPRFTDLLVQVATTVPLTLGETIDSAGLARPFERIPMLHKMMEQDVPADLTAMMPEFVRRCYMPASIWAADDPGVTFEKVVPWGSVMSTQLAKHHISTYADGALSLKRWAQGFLPGMFTADTTDCKRFYEGLETRVSNFLRGETTQQGSTMQQRYLDVLDLTAQSQARFYVMRELEKEMGQGAEVYAPEHVTALKRKVDVASFSAGALGNFDLTAPGRVDSRRNPEVHGPPVQVPGGGVLPGLLGAVHRRLRHVRAAGLLSRGGAVVAVSGPALQAAGQLRPAAHLRVLDAACGGRWSTSGRTWCTRATPRAATGSPPSGTGGTPRSPSWW